MFVNTQAVQISAETYPVAVACLGAAFATEPMDDVIGGYLVINQVSTSPRFRQPQRYVNRYAPPSPLVVQDPESISLANFFLAKDLFEACYKYTSVGAPPKDKSKFRSVKMIVRPETIRSHYVSYHEDGDDDAPTYNR